MQDRRHAAAGEVGMVDPQTDLDVKVVTSSNSGTACEIFARQFPGYTVFSLRDLGR